MIQKHYVKLGAHDPDRILLIGAGGTGSQMVTGLARMNRTLLSFGHHGLHLTVCDGDAVSASNVGRQLFSEADIGFNKATVLVSRANMFFGTAWEAYPQYIGQDSSLNTTPHIIITALDSAKARVTVRELFRRPYHEETYWLDTGNTRSTGQVILGTTGPYQQPNKDCADYLPHVLDLYGDIEKEDAKAYQGPSCSVEDSIRRQDLFINQWVATCALEILWKMFRKGCLTVHGAFANLDSFKVRPLPVDPDVWKSMGWERPRRKVKKKQKKMQ